MKAMARLLVMAAMVLLAACSTIPVSTDYDTSRDFTVLKTYTWMEPRQKLVIDPLVDNDLMAQRIQRSVEAELQKLGYVKASGNESADFLITYNVSSEDRISISTFHSAFGYYPCWSVGCPGYYGFDYSPDVYVRQYKAGTFMLDIIDPASQRLMWRGVSERRLTSGTPQERDDYVRATIGAILAQFPPKK